MNLGEHMESKRIVRNFSLLEPGKYYLTRGGQGQESMVVGPLAKTGPNTSYPFGSTEKTARWVAVSWMNDGTFLSGVKSCNDLIWAIPDGQFTPVAYRVPAPREMCLEATDFNPATKCASRVPDMGVAFLFDRHRVIVHVPTNAIEVANCVDTWDLI